MNTSQELNPSHISSLSPHFTFSPLMAYPMETSPSNISTPSTPSHTHSPQSQLTPESAPSPRAAVFDSGLNNTAPPTIIPRLDDYSTELRVLMDSNCHLSSNTPTKINTMDDTQSLFNSHEGSSSSDDGRQPYRHGQIGAFRHFPRYDQTSRPLVSDNWRADNGPSSPVSVTIPVMTPFHTRTGSQHSQPALQSRSPFLYTPTRSPLAAPVNPAIPGFARLSPKPPPTPTLLPTLASAAYSGLGLGYGLAHGRHLSAGSNNPGPGAPSASSASSSTNQVHSPNRNDANDGNTTHSPATEVKIKVYELTLSSDTIAYCFMRPDGTLTRLVPVDRLPYPLAGIFAREMANLDKFVVLPVPEGLGLDGRSSNLHPLVAVSLPGVNGGNGRGGVDAIQSQIDRILAAPTSTTPPTTTTATHPLPAHQHQHQHQLLTPRRPSSFSQNQNHKHTNPNTNTNNNHTISTTAPPKRMKVYCDKWVHEGVCAFTQQGCKYKHEMPSDKATQHQLGLFLGYPVWWKRRQGELSRLQVQTTGSSGSSAGGGGASIGGGNGGGSGGGTERRSLAARVIRGGLLGDADGAEGMVPRREPATVTAGRGLAASRWSTPPLNSSLNLNTNPNMTGPAPFRGEKPLRSSWRPTPAEAPTSSYSHRGSPSEQALAVFQGYDGTYSPSICASPFASSAAEPTMTGPIFNTGPVFNTNTHASTSTTTWPWEETPLYPSRHPTSQQSVQPRTTESPTSPFNISSPCSFVFRPSPTSSPYGPIAPPLPSGSTSTPGPCNNPGDDNNDSNSDRNRNSRNLD